MDWCLRIAHTPADTPAWLLPTQHHRRQHLWRLGPRGTETGRTLYLFERIDRDIVRGGGSPRLGLQDVVGPRQTLRRGVPSAKTRPG
jgi:hypothetical protein